MPARDYPDDFVEKALTLAATIGQRPAAAQLEIPLGTLHNWVHHPDNAERWAELRRIHAPKWRERAAVPLEDLVDQYVALQAEVLERTREKFKDIEPRDLGNLMRSIAVAQGVTADHVGKLRGQPTAVVQHQTDPAQLAAAMHRLLEQAPEPVDADVVELPAGDPDGQ